MEAIFHEDLRIQEWLDLIIEKLFTTCLLSGPDAEKEFEKGRNAVKKVAMTLQNVSSFPSSMLYDGVQQLIEQRLPDPRVIENFPKFNSLLEIMLKEGVQSINNTELNDDQVSTEHQNISKKDHIEIDHSEPDLIDQEEERAVPAMTTVTSYPPVTPTSNIRLRDVAAFGQNNLGKVTIKVTSEGRRYEIPLTPQVKIAQQIDDVLKENKDTSQGESKQGAGTIKEVYQKERKAFTRESVRDTKDIEGTKVPKAESTNVEKNEEIKEEINFILEPEDSNKISKAESLSLSQGSGEKEQNIIMANVKDIENVENTNSGNETVTETVIKRPNEAENKKTTQKINNEVNKEVNEKLNTAPKSKIIKKSTIPSGVEKFALLLQQLYPKSKIRWNRSLAGYDFLAQVEDLLFCLKNSDTEINQITKEMKEQGWAVVSFTKEDLQFPRRIEREIRFQLKQKIKRS